MLKDFKEQDPSSFDGKPDPVAVHGRLEEDVFLFTVLATIADKLDILDATVLSYRDNSNSWPEDSIRIGLSSNRVLHPLMLQPHSLEVLSRTSIVNSRDPNTLDFSQLRLSISLLQQLAVEAASSLKGSIGSNGSQHQRGRGRQEQGRGRGQAYVVAVQENAGRNVVDGMLLISKSWAHVLFDTGATHSFVSASLVQALQLEVENCDRSLVLPTPMGGLSEVTLICKTCHLFIEELRFSAD